MTTKPHKKGDDSKKGNNTFMSDRWAGVFVGRYCSPIMVLPTTTTTTLLCHGFMTFAIRETLWPLMTKLVGLQ
jgi:hypothetical protein